MNTPASTGPPSETTRTAAADLSVSGVRSSETVVPGGTSITSWPDGTNWPSFVVSCSETTVASSPGLVTCTARRPGPCGIPGTTTVVAGGSACGTHSTP